MRLAAALGLPYQASRALPSTVAPLRQAWGSLGGGLFAHRIYVEVGEAVPDGVEVERHVLAGSPDHLLAGFRAYQSLGVDDLSLVVGHDDRSAERTLDVLVREVLPRLNGTDISSET